MDALSLIIIALYTGLLIFALNGLQWVAVRNKQRELKADHERLRRLLMRAKLGRR